jgi:hypothetical protein
LIFLQRSLEFYLIIYLSDKAEMVELVDTLP